MSPATDLPSTHTCRVLIVEDNRDVRESLGRLLEMLGCRVEAAADGLEGVRKAVEGHPLLAFIDIGLPGLNGYQVAARLRGALDGGVLLVAYTAYDRSEVGERVVQAGFDGQVVKPADADQLLAWVDRAASTV